MLPKIIAIDFDGTITTKNEYPKIGELRPFVREAILFLRKNLGCYCYLWTCRTGASLEAAKKFLNENGIELDNYNDGPSTGSRKLVADIYIDDAAYPNNGEIDWFQILKFYGLSPMFVKEWIANYDDKNKAL